MTEFFVLPNPLHNVIGLPHQLFRAATTFEIKAQYRLSGRWVDTKAHPFSQMIRSANLRLYFNNLIGKVRLKR
jgi:hypothetical protein